MTTTTYAEGFGESAVASAKADGTMDTMSSTGRHRAHRLIVSIVIDS
jgi:hypothetical protein